MRISIFTLLSALCCALVTSCYYPPTYPQNSNQSVDPPVPMDDTVANDAAQKQLEEARIRLENGGLPNNNLIDGQLPLVNPNAGAQVSPPSSTYPYATKVPGKPGFVFNPYTKNQVDVRGIPSSTLVRDPNDADAGHKFRVP